jgi:two-component system, OmpR family, sensor histidine kinase VicK
MRRWVRASGKVYLNEEGGLSHFSGIILDITEQKQDEQRKNDFIGMVSHELKTPLTSMRGYLQMLQLKAKRAEDSFTASALEKSIKQVSKMTSLINGFLNVSRLESGKIVIDKKPFNLAELLKEMVEESLSIQSTHTISLQPCDSIIVDADRDKIASVISNLLSNAVKYSPQGNHIKVNCNTINGFVQVSVKDDGMGIKPQDIDKLFERFYRVDNKHTQTISGFGIGLYLCAEIVYRHEGKIWVESELGKGSIFYFNLPLTT